METKVYQLQVTKKPSTMINKDGEGGCRESV